MHSITDRLIDLTHEHSENGLRLIILLLFMDMTEKQQEDFLINYSRRNIDDLEKMMNEMKNDNEMMGEINGGYCRWPRKELAKILQFRSLKS